MNIAPLRDACASFGLDFNGKIYLHIEKSIEDGRYSLDQAIAWTTEKAAEFRDLIQYRDIFKERTEVESIKDIPSLKKYADELRIKIPDDTMKKMTQSMSEGRKSPSDIANYLRGVSYEQFLQSKNVPYLSEADHKHLAGTLRPADYKTYTASLASVSKKTGLPEPALDQIADKLLQDKAKAMKLYSDAISDSPIPGLRAQPESVIVYAKSVGVDIPPPRANLLCDMQLDNSELKKHIINSSFESFSKDDRAFSKGFKDLSRPKTITSIDLD